MVGGVATNLGLELDVDAALQFGQSLTERRRAVRARSTIGDGGTRVATRHIDVDVDMAPRARGASVMLHGRGLGAALATQVAARHPNVALCAERTFASLGSFVAEVAWVDFRERFTQLVEWERELPTVSLFYLPLHFVRILLTL